MFDFQKKRNLLFRTATLLTILTALFALAALAYLGTFTRYLADDYCESIDTSKNSPLGAVINRYTLGDWRAANRYSNLLFVGLADELLGESNIQILPGLMFFLWVVSSVWVVHGIRKLARIEWHLTVDCFLAVLLIFFAVWQAPNRFQTFFWRSSMATHFAPLVFLTILSGFIFNQIRSNKDRTPSLWICLFVFVASFLIGGFSEPPNTFAIAAMSLLLIYVWFEERGVIHRSAIHLLAWTLAGMVVSFLVMFFSPANRLHSQGNALNIPLLMGTTFKFTFDFILDTVFVVVPFPTLLSMLIPGLLTLWLVLDAKDQFSSKQKHRLWAWVALVPLIHYLLIAASFAPSVYGQSYPADRARFLGCLIMTTGLMLEGGLLGALIAQTSIGLSRRHTVSLVAGIVLLFLAFYPLRAGWLILADVPVYRKWTSAWDAREVEIYQKIAAGEKDLVVPLLPGWNQVKEIDGNTEHWVNMCAANYYGVNSIRSVPMGDK